MLALLTIAPSAVLFILLTPVIAWQPVRLDIWVVGSMVLLGAFGTGIAYTWDYNGIRAWGPTATSTVTYITPVIGVVLGVLVLQEIPVVEPAGGCRARVHRHPVRAAAHHAAADRVAAT